MLEIFQYGFIVRGFEAGVIVSLIAPLIGIFLVLRRYSLIADTLAHVSLAGVAVGLLLNVNPILTAIGTSVVSSVIIERLRFSKRIYGESALSVFLSGSLAVAVVLISLARGFNANLFSFLFGSILTVKQSDVWMIAGVGLFVFVAVAALYKELVYITFDEESATVAGIPTRTINTLFIVLSALTVSIAIPIVGVLLIAALIVIPTVTALQFRRSFFTTVVISEGLSVASVIAGLILSYYLNLPSGGTIVLVSLVFLILVMAGKGKS